MLCDECQLLPPRPGSERLYLALYISEELLNDPDAPVEETVRALAGARAVDAVRERRKNAT